MDVQTVFLYGNLDQVIYMKQPTGFAQKGKQNLVYKLEKGVYFYKGREERGGEWREVRGREGGEGKGGGRRGAEGKGGAGKEGKGLPPPPFVKS